MDEELRIMAQIQADARRRYYAQLDRQIAKRTDATGDLFRRGVAAVAEIKAEANKHELTRKPARDYSGAPSITCSCGWHCTVTRYMVAVRLADEKDELRRYGKHSS